MERQLTSDDFKHVKIHPQWTGIDFLATIAEFESERFNAVDNERSDSELPRNFQAAITAMGGSDWRLVMEKPLFASDVDKGQSRFSVPPGQTRTGSLDDEEVRRAESEAGTKVMFIEPSGEVVPGGLVFKRWKLRQNSNYVLKGQWNRVAKANGLQEHDPVQLWSFRVGSELGFALVRRIETRKEERE